MSPPADRTRRGRSRRAPSATPSWDDGVGDPTDDDVARWTEDLDELTASLDEDDWDLEEPPYEDAWSDGPVAPPDTHRRVLDDPPANPLRSGADDAIREAVGGARVAEIREFGRLVGIPLRAQRREELLDQLAAGYRDAAVLRELVERLRDLDRRVLALVAWIGPGTARELVEGLALLAPSLPAAWRVGEIAPRDLDHLVQRGVLLPDYRGQGGCLSVPAAVAAMVLPIAELVPSVAAPAETFVTRCDPVSSITRACLALESHGLFEAGLPGDRMPRSAGGPSSWAGRPSVNTAAHRDVRPIAPADSMLPATVRSVLAALVPPGAVDFHVALLAAIGVLRTATGRGGGVRGAGGYRLEVEPAQLLRFLSHDREARLSLLIDGWLQCAPWLFDELWPVRPGAAGYGVARRAHDWQFSWEDYDRDAVNRRQHALAWVRRLPRDIEGDSGWVDAGAFAKQAAGTRPSVVAPSPPSARWILLDAGGRQLAPGESGEWRQAAEDIASSVLSGPLHWLGLVEVAGWSRGRPVALRLTPTGRALRDGLPIPPSTGESLTWAGSLVTVRGSIGPATAALCRYGQAEHIAVEELRFRFTRDRAEAAFESGTPLDELLADLERAGVTPHSPVQDSLRTWWARWGTINRYDHVTLIECADEETLRELLVERELRHLVLCRLGPRFVAVAPDDSDRALELLRRAGHTPKVIEESPPRSTRARR